MTRIDRFDFPRIYKSSIEAIYNKIPSYISLNEVEIVPIPRIDWWGTPDAIIGIKYKKQIKSTRLGFDLLYDLRLAHGDAGTDLFYTAITDEIKSIISTGE